MKANRKRKLTYIILMLGSIGVAAVLILSALKDNINLFFTPSEAKAKNFPQNTVVRLGGMVKKGSVVRAKDSLKVDFIITDFSEDVHIVYEGILPNLFKEGQGVVVQGKFVSDTAFQAGTVLAKHDENYMPPNVADALRKQGVDLPGKPS